MPPAADGTWAGSETGTPDWPAGWDPAGAAVSVSDQIVIAATPERVFDWLERPCLWPRYYRHAHRISLEGGARQLAGGARFHWWTLGLPLTSVVSTYEPPFQLAWFADGWGVHAFHRWLIQADGPRVLVRTEETHRGLVPRVLRRYIEWRLSAAHEEWLGGLRSVAESGDPPPDELV